MKRNLVCVVLAFGLSALPLAAQWLNYPTPGIPRLSDGKGTSVVRQLPPRVLAPN